MIQLQQEIAQWAMVSALCLGVICLAVLIALYIKLLFFK